MSISDESVNVSDLAPIYDETYESYAYSKSFSVKSIDEGLNVCSNLYLNINNIDSNLKSKYFKWKLVSSDKEEFNGDFEESVNGEKLELINGIYFKSGQTKSYTLYIWLSYESDVNQTMMLGSELKSSLYIEGIDAKNRNSCEDVTLVNSILFDNEVTFDDENMKDGLYVTTNLNKTNDINFDGIGEKVYYYRGNVNNNYVKFNGLLFRIIRINEDGSVRLMLDESKLKGVFNSYKSDNTYVGYSVGINSGYSTSYGISTANLYDSDIKKVIDKWFNDNIIDKTYVTNTIYCNDRSLYFGNGFMNNKTIYSAYNRFVENNPLYKCINENDKLDLSVGLITIDELMYAGYISYNDGKVINDINNFLHKDNVYFTMSPYNYSDEANVFISNGYAASVDSEYYIYPVITIKGKANVLYGGDGTLEKPYVIE